MKGPGTTARRRLVKLLAAAGIALMGLDLLLTRNPFVHIAELMLASILCFVLALVLDRSRPAEKGGKPHDAGDRTG